MTNDSQAFADFAEAERIKRKRDDAPLNAETCISTCSEKQNNTAATSS